MPSSQYDTYRKFCSQYYYYFWYNSILHMYWIVISLLVDSQQGPVIIVCMTMSWHVWIDDGTSQIATCVSL
jgi:hypothetical protein